MKRLGLGLALVALVIAQQVLVVPGDTRLAEALHNWFHVPWFASVTLGLIILFGAVRGVLIALLVAVGSEFLQLYTGREASALDVARDLLGLACGLLARFAWQRKRAWPAIGAGGLLLLAGWPMLEAVIAKSQARERWPVLMDAALPGAFYYLEPTTDARTDAQGLHMVMSASGWPGVHLTEPVPDWCGYGALLVQLELDAGEPMGLFFGVRMTPEGGSTHYTLRQVMPGSSEIRVPLDELLPERCAPVHDLFIYTNGEHPGRRLSLRRVELIEMLPRECESSDRDRSCPGPR